jgi:regulator of protease activity HflC (stomatin/prohibitin superfamily)
MSIYQELNIAWEDRVIRPNLEEAIKASTALYTAEELITQRPLVKQDIEETFTERIKVWGIVVETVSITDFQFSPEFTKAIESKVTAEQEALRELNILEKIKTQALQAIEEAIGKREAEIVRANGTAQARIINAEAEAMALKVINEQLTPILIQLETINAWDGKLPTLLVLGENSDGSPFIIDIQDLLDQLAIETETENVEPVEGDGAP